MLFALLYSVHCTSNVISQVMVTETHLYSDTYTYMFKCTLQPDNEIGR